MSRPNSADLNDILGLSLMQLQDGQDIEGILAAYPDQAETLRPALEALQAVLIARGDDTVPLAAMKRSRHRLMKAAYDLKRAAPLPWWRQQPVFLGRVMVPLAAALVCIGMLYTGIASAKSLPGQPLYPVKMAAERIVLALPASPAAQLAREEDYDLRRNDEVEMLITQQAMEEVDQIGFLTQTSDQTGWQLDSTPLVVSPAVAAQLDALNGSYVDIHGELLSDGQLKVETIEPRMYLIKGTIQQMEPGRLLIGDIWVDLGDQAEVPAALQVGFKVEVSVVHTLDGSNRAERIVILSSPEPSRTPQNPQPVSTETENLKPRETAEAPEMPEATRESESEGSDGGPTAQLTPRPVPTLAPSHDPEPTRPSDGGEHTSPTPAQGETKPPSGGDSEHKDGQPPISATPKSDD